jgi:hypothetical protein
MIERRPGPQILSDSLSAFAEDNDVARQSRDQRIKRALEQAKLSRTVPTKEMIAEYSELINSCYLMKGALFNASQRLDRKRSAGQFTFALSGIYGFLVPLFTLQFEPFLTALVTNIVSFTAATAGAVSFVVAMIYQQRDLGGLARGYHEAGLKMNNLRRKLKITPFTHADQLSDAVHTYDDILVNAHNHDEIDFEYARLGSRPKADVTEVKNWVKHRRRLNARFILHTYGLLAMVWLIPPVIGIAIWLTLSNQIATAAQLAR